jgi:hypothetical protein
MNTTEIKQILKRTSPNAKIATQIICMMQHRGWDESGMPLRHGEYDEHIESLLQIMIGDREDNEYNELTSELHNYLFNIASAPSPLITWDDINEFFNNL